jgi:ADP-heptose:LPS heptosyltransferase
MKFLVIRLSSIGDIVFTTPAIRCLKQQAATATIHFLTKEKYKAVTESNPYIDQFYYWNDDWKNTLTQLQKEDYDYVIDLHNNQRTLLIKKTLQKKAFTIDKESFQKLLLTKLGINVMKKRHIVQRSLDTLQAFGIKDDGKGLDYFIPKAFELADSDIPMGHQAGYICLVIGATHHTKKLPPDQLITLCKNIHHPIILIGGPEDAAIGASIANTDSFKIYNACGKFNLHESADLVRRSKLVITHDTGMQYIGCAFQKPVYAIWGATSPALDVEAYYGSLNKPLHENIINPKIACQPCSKYGGASCPKKHFKCMQDLDMLGLATMVQKRLSNA